VARRAGSGAWVASTVGDANRPGPLAAGVPGLER